MRLCLLAVSDENEQAVKWEWGKKGSRESVKGEGSGGHGSGPTGIPWKGRSPDGEGGGGDGEGNPADEKADPTGLATCRELSWLMALILLHVQAPLHEARGVLSWLLPGEQTPCSRFALRPLLSCHTLRMFATEPDPRAGVAGRVCRQDGCCWDPG